MYCRIPLLLTLMAFLLVETHADFLDASFVGGTTSMPLGLELVQKVKDAGVITRDNPLYDTVSGPSRNQGTPTPEKLGRGAADETSTWAWIWYRTKGPSMGSGTMESDDGTQKATASGSLDGKRLSLAVMPMGSLDLYKLDLSLDIETTGRYTAYSSTGVSWSGEVSGTAPRGISSSTAYNSEDSQESYKLHQIQIRPVKMPKRMPL
jgi:hypothetical protein